jgi:pyrroline-5-carboxylate reductase
VAIATAETATGKPLTVGVIGTGNMGSALVRGWSRLGLAGPRLLVWDKVPGAVWRVAECERVVCADSASQLVTEADVVLVVVKPNDAAAVLAAIAPLLHEGHVLISSMAGVELLQLRRMAGPAPALFRVMPNLGVEVGAGTIAVAAEPGVDAERRIVELFGALGLAVMVPESMLDAVTAVSGTGPALLALALAGLEDGGVAAGLPRNLSRALARRTLLAVARTLIAGEAVAPDQQQPPDPAGDALVEGTAVLTERRVGEAFRLAVEAAAARAAELRAHPGGRT